MTRNLFLVCALMAAAALATGWALDPGCRGSFCLGSSFKTEAEWDRARASEVPNAGRELLGDNAQTSAPAAAPEARLSTEHTETSWSESEPLEQPDDAALYSEQEVETVSEHAQDRQATTTRRAARGDSEVGEAGEHEEPKLSYKERKAEAAAAAKAAKEWESLAEAALGEPDDELRGAAINDVGLHRTADAVAVLNEVAAFDPSTDNRMQAIEQLWYSAADGLDRDGGIRGTLQAALDDPDEAIAEMAEKALADLQALEQAQAVN